MKHRPVFLFAALLFASLATGLFWPSQTPLAAQSNCNCESGRARTETQSANWQPRAGSRVPTNLHGTARRSGQSAVGLWPPVFDLCDGVLIPDPTTTAFVVDPQTVTVYPGFNQASGVPHNEFKVQACGAQPDSEAVITLVAPNAQRTILDYGLLEGSGVADTWGVAHRIEQAGPLGSYVYNVEVQTADGVQSVPITILVDDYWTHWYDEYTGHLFALIDAASGQRRESFGPGETIQIAHHHHRPFEFVEAALYDVENEAAVNSWVFQADASGAFTESLTVPPGTPAGDYLIATSPYLEVAPSPQLFNFFFIDPDSYAFTALNGEPGFYQPLEILEPGEGAVAAPAEIGTAAQILLYDDYSDPTSGLTHMTQTANWGRNYYQDDGGYYIIEVEPESARRETHDLSLPESFTAELAATYFGPASNFYGLTFQVDENGSYYAFYISGNGNFLVGKRIGAWNELFAWTASDAIRTAPGELNRLQVTGLDGRYTLYVNGQEVAEFFDDDLRGGGVGPRAGAFGQAVEYVFDELVVHTE